MTTYFSSLCPRCSTNLSLEIFPIVRLLIQVIKDLIRQSIDFNAIKLGQVGLEIIEIEFFFFFDVVTPDSSLLLQSCIISRIGLGPNKMCSLEYPQGMSHRNYSELKSTCYFQFCMTGKNCQL